MSDTNNPFIGMTKAHDGVVEQLFSSIYAGGEWTDDHEEMLGQWRDARGDEAYDDWTWWVGYVGDESYGENALNRQKAIDLGQRDYRDEGKFQIIEACLWNDNVKEGEEVSAFARTRNHEIVQVADV